MAKTVKFDSVKYSSLSTRTYPGPSNTLADVRRVIRMAKQAHVQVPADGGGGR